MKKYWFKKLISLITCYDWLIQLISFTIFTHKAHGCQLKFFSEGTWPPSTLVTRPAESVPILVVIALQVVSISWVKPCNPTNAILMCRYGFWLAYTFKSLSNATRQRVAKNQPTYLLVLFVWNLMGLLIGRKLLSLVTHCGGRS